MPLMWHYKVLHDVKRICLQSLKHHDKLRKLDQGLSPFDEVVTREYASLDLCDYLMHLSNSSYSKVSRQLARVAE